MNYLDAFVGMVQITSSSGNTQLKSYLVGEPIVPQQKSQPAAQVTDAELIEAAAALGIQSLFSHYSLTLGVGVCEPPTVHGPPVAPQEHLISSAFSRMDDLMLETQVFITSKPLERTSQQ